MHKQAVSLNFIHLLLKTIKLLGYFTSLFVDLCVDQEFTVIAEFFVLSIKYLYFLLNQ